MTLKIKLKAEREGAELPFYATPGSAGADLMAANDEPIVIEPGQRAIIPLGFSAELPVGFEAQIRPRSGIAIKYGVTVLNAPGTIDSDYRGEWGAMLINFGEDAFVVKCGDRVAQMVIAPACQMPVDWATEDLSETMRGTGGYGSTGVSKQ